MTLDAQTNAEIQALTAQIAWTADHTDLEGSLACVTDDATIKAGTMELTGKAAIREWMAPAMASGAKTRHAVTNMRITSMAEDGAEATLTVIVTAVRPDATVITVGEYHDMYRRQDGYWLLARREILPFAVVKGA